MNSLRGEIEFEKGGKERKAKLTFAGIREIEERFKLKGADDIRVACMDLNTKIMTEMLFVSCRHFDSALTRKEVESWEFSMSEIVKICGQLIASAWGITDETTPAEDSKKN